MKDKGGTKEYIVTVTNAETGESLRGFWPRKFRVGDTMTIFVHNCVGDVSGGDLTKPSLGFHNVDVTIKPVKED